MPRSALVAVGSLVLLALLVCGLWWRERAQVAERPLVVLAAPTVRGPLEQVAADYERFSGRPVELVWGPSEQLVTNARYPAAHRPADVLLPADDSYLVQARDLGLLSGWTPLADTRAVLLLPPGNPKHIATWSDVAASGVRVAIPNDSAAVGRLTREHLKQSGKWNAVRANVTDFLSVTDAATATKVGSVDAAVVWDAVATGPNYRTQAMLAVPELAGVRGRVAAAVLHQSSDQAGARAFVEYLSGRGRERFRAAGFVAE